MSMPGSSAAQRPAPGRVHGKFDLKSIELVIAAAAVFFIPFNLLRFSFFYFTLADFLLLVSLSLRLYTRSFPTNPLRTGGVFWIGGILLLCTGFMASSTMNGSLERGLIVTGQYVFCYLVLPFAILGRPWPQTLLLVKMFCYSIFVICIFGVYLIHVDGQTNTRFVSGNGRLRSFMERENALAALIAMTVPLLLWLAAVKAIRRIVAAIGLVTMVYGTMLTGSNTGLFALAIAVVAYVVLAMPLRRALTIGAIGLAAVYFSVTLGRDYMPRVFQRRVLSALDSGSLDDAGTFEDRFSLILESLQFARDTMLIGFGPDQYRVISFWEAPVHNAYTLIWTEGGLIALTGFVAVLAGGYLASVSTMTVSRGRSYGTPAICIITTFALLINAAPHVYARFWITPVVLAIGIAVAFLNHGPVDRPRFLLLARSPSEPVGYAR